MENQLFQYNPTSEGNTENGHKVILRNDIMSVLGLNLGYAELGSSPLGSGHISPYIPCLVLIRIQ